MDDLCPAKAVECIPVREVNQWCIWLVLWLLLDSTQAISRGLGENVLGRFSFCGQQRSQAIQIQVLYAILHTFSKMDEISERAQKRLMCSRCRFHRDCVLDSGKQGAAVVDHALSKDPYRFKSGKMNLHGVEHCPFTWMPKSSARHDRFLSLPSMHALAAFALDCLFV
jgi:hypothetical protein